MKAIEFIKASYYLGEWRVASGIEVVIQQSIHSWILIMYKLSIKKYLGIAHDALRSPPIHYFKQRIIPTHIPWKYHVR
jgi:hypothetical protein